MVRIAETRAGPALVWIEVCGFDLVDVYGDIKVRRIPSITRSMVWGLAVHDNDADDAKES